MNSIALSSSISSLLLLEKQMGVISNNISNANTAGYTAESEVVGEQVTDGVGSGVQDLGTVDNVDQFLQASVMQANSTSAQATTYNSFYQDLQQVMGQIGTSDTGGDDISSQLATLQATLSQLATTPQNTALSNEAVANLSDLTSNMQSMSQQIQQLRSTADQQISDTVADVNTQLNLINKLNVQISTAQATNQPTASLTDQRSQALQSLTADIGVGYYTSSNGALQIYTTAGQPLLTGDVVNEVSHTAENISGAMSYPSGGISGIMVGNTDITTQISSGKLASLIQQRDTELPNAQNALNTLAQTVATSLNAASNLGTASPPPSTLTSAAPASYQSTDSVSPSVANASANPPTSDLTVRIALVDNTGQVQAYQDVDLAGLTTVGQIVSQINTAFGTTVASINGSGQMVLTAPASGTTVNSGSSGSSTPVTLSSSTGIAVNTLQGTLNGTDFSSFFHLNDVVTGGSSAATISVNPAILANSNLLPVGTLNGTQPAPTVPFSGVGAGDGSTASALSQALLNNQTFSNGIATGTLPVSGANSATNLSGTFIIKGGAQPVSVTITQGQTLAEIAAAINAAATSAGATGVTAQVVGNGVCQLQISSGGNTLSFAKVTGDVLSGLGISGSPSGYLGGTSTTLGNYASNLISDVANRATTAQSDQTATTTTLTALQTSLSNQSGVNIDQQTAELSTLQNLYAASARVITTVNAMFTSLIDAVDGTS